MNLRWWERLLAAGGAFTLVASLPQTDEIGFALALVFLFVHHRRSRAAASALAS